MHFKIIYAFVAINIIETSILLLNIKSNSFYRQIFKCFLKGNKNFALNIKHTLFYHKWLSLKQHIKLSINYFPLYLYDYSHEILKYGNNYSIKIYFIKVFIIKNNSNIDSLNIKYLINFIFDFIILQDGKLEVKNKIQQNFDKKINSKTLTSKSISQQNHIKK